MRLIARAAVIAAVFGIGLFGVTSGPAHAAMGWFVYFSAYENNHVLFDPDAGCHILEPTAVVALNLTNADAIVYSATDCAPGTEIATMPPGESGVFPSGAASVEFLS